MQKFNPMKIIYAYAGNHRYLILLGRILAVISAWIAQLMKNKTVLMIAHRMRTISDADNIVVLKDGIVAEHGKPDELIRQNGIYRNMLDKQQKSEIIKNDI